jgi:hypothetical protein
LNRKLDGPTVGLAAWDKIKTRRLTAIELRLVGRPALSLVTVPTELYASVMEIRQYESGYVYRRLGIYCYSLLLEGIGRIISPEVYAAGGFIFNCLKKKIGLK